jgi:hypothetical protein
MKTIVLHEKGQKKLGDKLEFLYTLDQTESSVDRLIDSLREHVSKEGKSVQDLIDPDNASQVIQEYEAIRKYLGVCPGKSEQEVWGFIRLLLKSL